MQEYTKDINLNFKSNIKNIKQQLAEMEQSFSEITSNQFDGSGKPNSEPSPGFSKSIFEFSEAVNDFIRNTDGLQELFTVELPTTWTGMFSKVTKKLMNLFSQAWDELDTMMSYNYLSNESVRELRLTYGLDAGESYAYSKIADIMGISSLEDFTFMSDKEYELFNKYYQEFYGMFEEYGSDEGLSDSVLEFKVSMESLKIEILKPFLEVINSPEVRQNIKTLIRTIPQLLEKLVDFATTLVGLVVNKDEREKETEEQVKTMYGGREVPDYVIKQKSTELAWSPIISSAISSLFSNSSNDIKKDAESAAKAENRSQTLVVNNYVDGVKKSSTMYEDFFTGNAYTFSNNIQALNSK